MYNIYNKQEPDTCSEAKVLNVRYFYQSEPLVPYYNLFEFQGLL